MSRGQAQRGGRGVTGTSPRIDQARCDGCGRCVDACPEAALLVRVNTACARCVKYCSSMEVPCHPVRVLLNEERCIGCGTCVAACPSGAISASPDPAPSPGRGRRSRHATGVKRRGQANGWVGSED